MVKLKIGQRLVGDNEPCFFIAEIGSNHDRDIKKAKRLIDAAKEAGADCVKFQTFRADELVVKFHPAYKMLKRLELSVEWHQVLADYCMRKKIIFASTPFYLEAIDVLEDINIPFYKISSGDLNYWSLIRKISRTKKPIFLSTGLASLAEVKKTIQVIKKEGNGNIAVLHCVSLYPPDIEGVNLNSLLVLKDEFGLVTGLSDHTRSLAVALGAVAMGASIIERHFTLSRNTKGPDHSFAMEPYEFTQMVLEARELEKAKGDYKKKPFGKELERRCYVRRKRIMVDGRAKFLRTYPGYRC